MPILKVTVWDISENRKKKLICASDAAELPSVRKNLSAVIGRFDTLAKVRASQSMLILDIDVAVPEKDYQATEWNSPRPIESP